MQIKNKKFGFVPKIVGVVAIALLLPLILLIVVPMLVFYFIEHLWLMFLVKTQWLPKGKSVLLVYSDSPHWKEYIEQNVLPKIESKAVVLNWSKKNSWNWRSLEVRIFKHWSQVKIYRFQDKTKWDGEEYNPMAVVFNSRGSRVIRLWKAFKDYKHGKEKLLREMEIELFSFIEPLKGSS